MRQKRDSLGIIQSMLKRSFRPWVLRVPSAVPRSAAFAEAACLKHREGLGAPALPGAGGAEQGSGLAPSLNNSQHQDDPNQECEASCEVH